MRVISIRKEKILMVIYGLLIAGGLASAYLTESAPAFAMPVSKKVIVIDAGHGGWDPGVVRNKVEEKDINLTIAKKLQGYLEEGGATVLITRLDDSGLADSKAADMRLRSLTANAGKADIFISIHQNSLGIAGVKGAQVFYFNESDNSKKLGESIQRHLREFVDPNNKFLPKANSNYFVLKQTSMPAVIVECGFLSNPGERAKLVTEEYQERIAWGIYLGIVDYFNGE
jgi:N-acetylmuramoyl-L-alanine amidase